MIMKVEMKKQSTWKETIKVFTHGSTHKMFTSGQFLTVMTWKKPKHDSNGTSRVNNICRTILYSIFKKSDTYYSVTLFLFYLFYYFMRFLIFACWFVSDLHTVTANAHEVFKASPNSHSLTYCWFSLQWSIYPGHGPEQTLLTVVPLQPFRFPWHP